ncbi:hypothetical protein ABH941_007762 [Streptacidiphilus sp. EB103A]
MNRTELRTILESEGFRPDAYSLNGGLPSETYCLSQQGNGWVVYYSERGIRSGLRPFRDEAEACAYFLEQLRHDPCARP